MENSTTSTTQTPIVTTAQTCLHVDGHALFYANAGVPVDLVFEQAGILLGCIETLILSRDSLDEQVRTTTLQYLTDLAKALVSAGYEGICARERSLAG